MPRWTGFTEKPPYSVLMIDELLNERDAINANLDSSQSSLANYERLLASLRSETKAAEEAVSGKLLALQNADDATREAAKWRMEAARAKSRVLAARAGLMQSVYDSLKDRITAATTDLALIDRKIKVAKASSRFNDDDLAKIEKISEDRKKAAPEGTRRRFQAAQVRHGRPQPGAVRARRPAGRRPARSAAGGLGTREIPAGSGRGARRGHAVTRRGTVRA